MGFKRAFALTLAAVTLCANGYAAITGVVYQDYNGNGVRDTATTIANAGSGNGNVGVALDKLLASVTVTATCVTGNGSDGSYGTPDDVRTTYPAVVTDGTSAYSITTTGALAGTAANPACRVSFSWDAASTLVGGVPNPLFGMFPSFAASSGTNPSNTSTQFVSPDGTADLGLNYPPEFCQNNPTLATTCFTFGAYDSTARTHLYTFPYSGTSPYVAYTDTPAPTFPAPTPVTANTNIGSTWGLGYHKPTKLLATSAYLKRHIGVGPGGLGQIYTVSAAGVVANLVNLGAVAAGANPRVAGNDYDLDAAVLSATEGLLVGKRGIGDIDFSDDYTKLYAIGLGSKRLYIVPVNATLTGTTGATTEVTLPTPAIGTGATDCPAASDVRPFALKFSKGSLYVGMTCTAESTGVASNLRAYVYRFDAAGGSPTQVSNFQLTGTTLGWGAWDNVEPAPAIGCCSERPQPMLTDIEFNAAGNLILGIRDRFGDITSGGALDITNTRRVDGRGNGDTILACLSGSTYAPANCPTSGIDFYNDTPTYPTGGTDGNGSMGGLVQVPGFADVVTTTKDPSQIYSSGIGWLNNSTGAYTKGYEILPPGEALASGVRVNGFKSSGMGDLEALCDAAPLEVGNRVWRDLNGDGVQDAGEPPIAGVTVNLYAPGGTTPLATAVTDANGNYYFNNKATDENGNALSQTNGGATVNAIAGLTANTNGFSVCLDNATNYAAGGPLAGLLLTTANAATAGGDTSNSGLTDLQDSDFQINSAGASTTCAGRPSVVFNTSGSGQNNFGLDAGFTALQYSLGNRVWLDANNSGTVDGTEAGVDGVVVELLTETSPGTFTPSGTTLTTANGGYYRFDGLAAGNYRVRVNPSNFGASGPLRGYFTSGTPNADAEGPSGAGVNNDNNGIAPAGGNYVGLGVTSGTVTLGGTSEPTDDNTEAGTVGANTYNATNSNGTAAPDNQYNASVDFGFHKVSIGNRVWLDTGAGANTNNGTFDSGEANVPDGTVVILVDNLGNVIATTTTVGGTYMFMTTTAGNPLLRSGAPADLAQQFRVVVTPPAGYASSTPTFPVAAGNDERDHGAPTAVGGNVQSPNFTFSNLGTNTNGQVPDAATATTAQPQLDFGLVPTFSLGNRVWFDANNSGTVDGTESGVDGVVVELLTETTPGTFTPSGTTLTTANGGYYRFDGLAAGNYRVRVNPSNFGASGPLSGYFTSGTPNADAEGPSGVGVNNDNNGIAPAGGNYVGLGVSSGTVTLGGATPEPTTDNTEAGTVGANTYNSTNSNGTAAPDNQYNASVDFGFHKVSIGNRVWFDTGAGALTNNGVLDAGEPGVNGVTVELRDGAGNLIATVTTANVGGVDGVYMFMTDTAGNPLLLSGAAADIAKQFRVVIPTPPTGAVSSTPTETSLTATGDSKDHGAPGAGTAVQSPLFTVTPGATTNAQTVNNATATTDQPQLDFGFVPQYSIGNRVWLDTNGDGVRQAAELGKDGVVVNLLNGSGQPLYRQADGSIGTTVTATPVTTTTAGGGYYRFDGLPPGDYVVQIAPINFQPGGMLYSASTSAPLPATTTNVGGVDGSDNNSNGVADANPGTNGIRSGAVTLGNGTGSEEPLNEADLGPGNQGSADNRADMTVDFGFVPVTFALGNIVFVDANNNGIKDGGETGIGTGVTVSLYADANGDGVPDGAAITTTTTNGDGQYLFSGLPEGRYVVEISGAPLAGYTSSTGLNGGLSGPYEPGSTDFSAAGNDRDHGRNVSPGVIRSGTVALGSGMPTGEGADLTVTDPNTTPDNRTNLTVDFGVFLPATVGTVVWIDNGASGGVSGDGIKQPGEPGIPGVIVRLLDGNGNPVDGDPVTPGVQPITTTTGQNGEYSITNLTPGIYQVEFAFPPGSRVVNTVNPPGSGTPAVGPDNQRNEMSPSTQRTPSFTLAPGDNNPNLDSGVLAFDATPAVVPTVGEWAKLLLAMLLFGVALIGVRRRAAYLPR
jgi:SdrD B-like domain